MKQYISWKTLLGISLNLTFLLTYGARSVSGEDDIRLTFEDKAQQNIEFYNANPDLWIKIEGYEGDSPFWKGDWERYHEILPAGSILEIGASGGRDAKYFLDAGYTYTGIDASGPLLERVRKRYPGATFLQENIYKFNLRENTFDGFWFVGLPVHIPQEHLKAVLVRIRSCLKPDAFGFMGVFITKNNGPSREYFDPTNYLGYQPGGGRWIYSYNKGEFFKQLQDAGFVVQEYYTSPHGESWGPSGKDVEWLKVFVRAQK